MNSILTMEERTLLQSLGCKDKAQAIAVLSSIKMDVPVRSELFASAVTLGNKLENEKVDFAAEIIANNYIYRETILDETKPLIL